jgi:hypothetical protein
MDVSPGAPARSHNAALAREFADVLLRGILSAVLAWILYAAVAQLLSTVPGPLSVEIFGRLTQWFGPRALSLALIGIVLIVCLAQIRSRGRQAGLRHGLRVWLLQLTYGWSLLALILFALVVIGGAFSQSLAELRWLRDALFLAVDLAVLIAARKAYLRATRGSR